MRADHELSLAILRAAGLSTDRVKHVSCEFPLHDAASITVTYLKASRSDIDTEPLETVTCRFTADIVAADVG